MLQFIESMNKVGTVGSTNEVTPRYSTSYGTNSPFRAECAN